MQKPFADFGGDVFTVGWVEPDYIAGSLALTFRTRFRVIFESVVMPGSFQRILIGG